MSTEAKRAADRAAARRKAAIARGDNPLLITGDRLSLARIRIPSRMTALSGPCAGEGDLFFSPDSADQDQAREICQGCPVRMPCLRGALERGEPWGIWGGALLDDGRIVREIPAEVAS